MNICTCIAFFFLLNVIIRLRDFETFFMLNSAEHEILNAHKYKNIKKLSIIQAQISLECYFSCSYRLKSQRLLAFQHL